MEIDMGVLILGVILQYMFSASFSCFLWVKRELTKNSLQNRSIKQVFCLCAMKCKKHINGTKTTPIYKIFKNAYNSNPMINPHSNVLK